jgi:methylmalonyl-CoA/ethylmalonyl-CoA epimerase
MTELMRFHHVGVACRDIESEAKVMLALGYQAESADFTDPAQGIRGRFVVGSGPRMELLEQTSGSHVLEPWLAKGVKAYHFGYEVGELEKVVERLKSAGAIVVTPLQPAVAFAGRRITFLMLKNMFLVELIEASGRNPALPQRGRGNS